MRPLHFWSMAVCVLAMSGCSTTTELLRLQKSDREQILASERETDSVVTTEQPNMQQSDLYLFVNASVFNSLLANFDNSRFSVDSGRKVDIVLQSVRLNFRPGSSSVAVTASAVDVKTGIHAAIALDARIIVQGNPNSPGTLRLKLVATKVVPELTWSILNLTSFEFVRALLSLQVTKITNQVPEISVPVASSFLIGNNASTQPITIPLGNETISGNIGLPATFIKGNIVVNRVLFLANGVHIFANVGGL